MLGSSLRQNEIGKNEREWERASERKKEREECVRLRKSRVVIISGHFWNCADPYPHLLLLLPLPATLSRVESSHAIF